MSQAQCQEIIDGLCSIPEQMQTVLDQSEQIKEIALKFCDRGELAVPGPRISLSRRAGRALKLKEISYIHAEGMPAAEMKHGPIALITTECPSSSSPRRDCNTTR